LAIDAAREVTELWAAGTPIVYVVTHEESRAAAMLEQVAAASGGSFGVWSTHRGLYPVAVEAHEPLEVLAVLDSEIAPSLVALLDFHDALADRAVVRRLRDLVPRLQAERRCVVIVAPELRLPEGLAADAAVLRLPLPDEAGLGAIVDELLAAAPGGAPPAAHRDDAVRGARGLTGTQARRAFLRGLLVDPGLGPDAIPTILAEKRRILSRDLGLEDVETLEKPEDIGGLEGFKAWLFERAQAMAPDAQRYGLSPPRGVLLVGVQGCGKSLSAKCAAAQLGVPLLRLDLPRVLGAGEGGRSAEESLARALAAAESVAPVALWVDEIEKGFAGSGGGRDSRASRLLGAFSTWLQERTSPVFVVATANDVTALPPELLRRGRFDELFFVDLPDARARRTVFAVHLRRRARDPADYDVGALATVCEHFSGAEIEQVVIGGLHRAFASGRDLETADMHYVAEEMVPLYRTYEENIKALREWSIGRCRTAGRQDAVVDLFRRA
jgi:ATPase family associated with various cellular activities (AAA)